MKQGSRIYSERNGFRATPKNLSKSIIRVGMRNGVSVAQGYHQLSKKRRVITSELLARFSAKDLMKFGKRLNLNAKEKTILVKLLAHRSQFIPGTGFELRGHAFRTVQLVNAAGEERAKKILLHFAKTSRRIGNGLSRRLPLNVKSDAVANATAAMFQTLSHSVELIKRKEVLAHKLEMFIQTRRHEIEKLKQMPNMKNIRKEFEEQLKDAEEALAKYSQTKTS
jgi:hypothetical protein